jgi:hypothetical protein
VVIGVVVVGVVAAFGRAASATFGAVLYRYAADGVSSGPFDEGDFASITKNAAPAERLY